MKLKIRYLIILLLLNSGYHINAQPGTIDATFNPVPGPNNGIYASALQNDGKILIVGLFTAFNGAPAYRIARLNPDGTLDVTFTTGAGANNTVNTVVIQNDGKILIGGNFSAYDGTARKGIARLNADGSIDNTFNPGTGANDYYNDMYDPDGNYSNTLYNGSVYAIAVQADGKILVGGAFQTFNGVPGNDFVRLNSDGSVDMSFIVGLGFRGYQVDEWALSYHLSNGSVRKIAIQSDGKIIVGGGYRTYDNATRSRIARLNSDGSIDLTFDPGTGVDEVAYFDTPFIYDMTILNDGRIIVVGSFTMYNGFASGRIARINSDGSFDPTFVSGTGFGTSLFPSVNAFAMSIQSNGKIVVGGGFNNYNGNPSSRITRLNADGTIDPTFVVGTGFNGNVHSLAIQNDGKILAFGGFSNYNGDGRIRLARIEGDSNTASIPTLSEWGMIFLTVLMLGFGIMQIRRSIV